ncbi:hypothetical protein K435DRAFT_805143 [Dendrothele bispora CBS 962.96]|uniref:Uncharacterized protein n=1 Tax=Dendrothele bispora (strain CBS 962.96) TaxID=1314807 RepID=A0A4S8LCF1_DENBC|nr:hypothetical protein K435DRAFT_805143 [Dendrothele bispora CBS 962.96]
MSQCFHDAPKQTRVELYKGGNDGSFEELAATDDCVVTTLDWGAVVPLVGSAVAEMTKTTGINQIFKLQMFGMVEVEGKSVDVWFIKKIHDHPFNLSAFGASAVGYGKTAMLSIFEKNEMNLDALAQDKSRAQLQFELAAANYALAASNLSTSSYRVAASLVKAEAAIPGRLEELTNDSLSSAALKDEIANLESSRETFGIEYPVEGANCDEDGQFELPPELVEWFEKHSELPPGAPRRKNPPPREYLREGADIAPARQGSGSSTRKTGRKTRKN